MKEQQVKTFRAAYDYWFDNKTLNEAVEAAKPEAPAAPATGGQPPEQPAAMKNDKKKKKHEKGESKKKEKKEEHEAEETEEEEEVEEKAKKKAKKGKKKLKEAFETHVLCAACGSGELQLSKKKTKIRCNDCGNVGLTEGIAGLEVNERKDEAKEEKNDLIKGWKKKRVCKDCGGKITKKEITGWKDFGKCGACI